MKVSGSTSVAATSTSPNLLAGLPQGIIFPPGAYVSLLANAANGSNAGDITCAYYSGTTPELGKDGQVVNVAAAAGVLDPRTDTIIDRMAVVGQQQLYFSNSSAAAIVVQWTFEIHG